MSTKLLDDDIIHESGHVISDYSDYNFVGDEDVEMGNTSNIIKGNQDDKDIIENKDDNDNDNTSEMSEKEIKDLSNKLFRYMSKQLSNRLQSENNSDVNSIQNSSLKDNITDISASRKDSYINDDLSPSEDLNSGIKSKTNHISGTFDMLPLDVLETGYKDS